MADGLRVATWHADFSRKGPGLLLRDMRDDDPGIDAAVAEIAAAAPDVIVLTSFDYDHGGVALAALAARIAAQGPAYDHRFAARPNTGLGTGRDLDGDGLLGGPRDAQGYGWFAGQGGQAVLSRYPVTLERSLTDLLWRDAPDSRIAGDDPGHDLQRLSSSAHWALRVDTPHGPWRLLTLAATPPVFDGPEDRNGRRNADEVLLWAHVLDGHLGGFDTPLPTILVGNLNLDPERGEGLGEAAQTILDHPRLQDPLPGQPSVTWPGPGEMRVSYVLPTRDLHVLGAATRPEVAPAGPHRLVWVDLAPAPGSGPEQSPDPARLAARSP